MGGREDWEVGNTLFFEPEQEIRLAMIKNENAARKILSITLPLRLLLKKSRERAFGYLSRYPRRGPLSVMEMIRYSLFKLQQAGARRRPNGF
jgi:hypothetical protein